MKKLYLLLIVILLLNSLPVSLVCADEASYTQTKLSVGDLVYNPNTKTLMTTAELVTVSSSAPSGDAPSASGTIVLAAYRRGELVAVNTSDFANLTGDAPFQVSLRLASVSDVSVKAFIVDSFNFLTPLTITKGSTDVTELIVYEDVVINDRRIVDMENFEPDPRKYHELVKNFSLSYSVEDQLIEVREDQDGNHYLLYEGASGKNGYFSAVDLGDSQWATFEFDVYNPTKSTFSVSLYDESKSYFTILSCDTRLKLTSNKKAAGYLDEKNWVRLSVTLDNEEKLVNVYVNGEHTGVDIPMAGGDLINLSAIRIWGPRTYAENQLMLDNVIAYYGTELYDYSKNLNDEIDYGSTSFEHNKKGVEEFFKSYNAIHTVTGKLYVDSLDMVTKMPYRENDVLYVALPDAEKLVFGKASSSSEEYVALQSYAQANGKKLTFNATNTVLVGDKEAVISDRMIKYVNAYMTYDYPDYKELMNSFNNVHPRLIINAERVEKIKSEYGKDEHITKWADTFIKQADGYLKASPYAFVEMDGHTGRLLNTARSTKERIQKLALSYLITGETEYVDRAWLEIENVCNFPYWHQGYNELDSSMMASAVAFGYDWLYDKWTESQRKIMEDALCKHQLDQAQEAYHGVRSYGAFMQANNWNPHCNGFTAVGAIAIFETNPEKYADIISNAIGMLDYAMVDFYPDGAWKEGTGYWSSSVMPIAELCSSLHNGFGSSYNIENTACFDVTCDFIIGNAGPTANNNYNDTGDSVGSAPAFLWFANTFNNPTYAIARLRELDGGICALNVLDFCFFDTEMELGQSQEKLDYYFAGLELVSLKSAVGDPNAAYVSFHSGNSVEAGPHTHIDSGTFVIDMLGERIAHDPGSHNYYVDGHGRYPDAQPEDDGDTITRWDYYHHVPEGHNCFIINPDLSIGQNIVTDDKIEEFESSSDCAYAITSLTSAYEGYAKNARRGIMLCDNRQSVVIRDEIELNSGNNEVYWFMHKAKDSTIDKIDDRTYIMTQNGKKIKIVFVTNAASAHVYEADPVHMVRTPPPQQEEITDLNKLVIRMSASSNLYLQVKFIPLDSGYSDVPINNLALDSWNIN